MNVTSRRVPIVQLATYHRMPATFATREIWRRIVWQKQRVIANNICQPAETSLKKRPAEAGLPIGWNTVSRKSFVSSVRVAYQHDHGSVLVCNT